MTGLINFCNCGKVLMESTERLMIFNSAAAVGGTTQRGATAGSLPPEVQTALGLNQQQFQQIQSLNVNLGFKNTLVFRVTSVGKSGDVTRTVQMIVSKGGAAGGRPQVMSWKEL